MSGAIFIDGASNFHPYECNGPGKCIHCDGVKTEQHHPDHCWLCHDGPPPGECRCGGSGVIDTGEPSDAGGNIFRDCPDCSQGKEG